MLGQGFAWGNDVGDSMLVTQLQSAKLVVDAARSIASAELSLRRARDASPEQAHKGKHISSRQVEIFNDFTSRTKALDAYGMSFMEPGCVGGIPRDDFHCDLADGMLNFTGVNVALESEALRLRVALPEIWATGVKDLIAAVNTFVPQGWEPFKDQVLQTPLVLKAFLDMPELHYNRLGPLAKHIQSEISLLKSLDHRCLDVNLVQTANAAVTLASTTAVFKFVITAVKVDMPRDCPSPAEGKSAVDKVRGHIADFNVELSAELEQELQDWASGK